MKILSFGTASKKRRDNHGKRPGGYEIRGWKEKENFVDELWQYTAVAYWSHVVIAKLVCWKLWITASFLAKTEH